MQRKLPVWMEVALLVGGAAITMIAVVTGVWLAAVYMAYAVVALGVVICHRWRTGEYLTLFASPTFTKAQQIALGYALSLPFWLAMWIYQDRHPAVLVAFVLGTLVAAMVVALEIRRSGWSRGP